MNAWPQSGLDYVHAGVAELVYAPVLGTGPARDGGSSPLPSTDCDLQNAMKLETALNLQR